MKTILIVLAIAIGVFALMMAGLGIKMLMHKQKEFKRPCTNADPRTGRCANCTCHRKDKAPMVALVLCLLAAGQVAAQNDQPANVIIKHDTIYLPGNPEPTYPGGESALAEFLYSNLNYPEEAMGTGTSGVVEVRFRIDVDGTIDDIRIVKDPGHGLGAEVVRVVRKMRRWNPAYVNGHPAVTYYTLSISFEKQQAFYQKKHIKR
jgi:TonB family protein